MNEKKVNLCWEEVLINLDALKLVIVAMDM